MPTSPDLPNVFVATRVNYSPDEEFRSLYPSLVYGDQEKAIAVVHANGEEVSRTGVSKWIVVEYAPVRVIYGQELMERKE